MAERSSVWLLWLAAVLLLVVGVPSFLAPEWARAEFPWAVGPFLAQTIGGWSLGTAAMAATAALVRRPDRRYPLLIYLGLFGLGELVVVLAFADRLQTGHLLTWPYVGSMLALTAGAVAGGVAIWRAGGLAAIRRPVGRVPRWAPLLAVAVGGFVLLLAVGTLLAGPDGATARGGIFPEEMGLFSIRAFSAFLFALAVSITSTLFASSMRPYRELALSGLYLIAPITLAALLNLSLFDFTARPGGLVYLVAYIVVGVILAIALVRHTPEPEADPGAARAQS